MTMKANSIKNQNIRGQLIENAPLGKDSWFGCGGTADLLFRPADVEDLQIFLCSPPFPPASGGEARSAGGEITILGGLANTIIRDGGIRGVTIQLGKEFANIKTYGDEYVEAGAGALNGSVAAAAMKAGIGGLEFLSGIPGCVGGALKMNAGAYGTEMKDVLVKATAMNHKGESLILIPSSRRKPGSSDAMEKDPGFCRGDDLFMDMTYRHTDIPDGTIFTGAIFKGKKENYDVVKARMTDIKTRRNETQPIREKTGGSTFANPGAEELKRAGLPQDTRAWKIVELVGGRGLIIGGAQMSEMHCNFMINTGHATAADLENLGEELRRRAKEQLGINLRWEINRVGEK